MLRNAIMFDNFEKVKLTDIHTLFQLLSYVVQILDIGKCQGTQNYQASWLRTVTIPNVSPVMHLPRYYITRCI